jgi:hypothetical protein
LSAEQERRREVNYGAGATDDGAASGAAVGGISEQGLVGAAIVSSIDRTRRNEKWQVVRNMKWYLWRQDSRGWWVDMPLRAERGKKSYGRHA